VGPLRHRRAAAGAVLVALLTAGCGREAPEPAPSPAPSPSPSPSPTFDAVTGTVTEVTTDVRGRDLGTDDGAEPDTAAIAAATAEVTSWLDGHLDAVQRGDVRGRLDDVAAPGLLEALGDAGIASLAAALVPDDSGIGAAAYTLQVQHGRGPVLVAAQVSVRTRAGGLGGATVVLAATGYGMVLQAVEEGLAGQDAGATEEPTP
jgi:hypothetical protein